MVPAPPPVLPCSSPAPSLPSSIRRASSPGQPPTPASGPLWPLLVSLSQSLPPAWGACAHLAPAALEALEARLPPSFLGAAVPAACSVHRHLAPSVAGRSRHVWRVFRLGAARHVFLTWRLPGTARWSAASGTRGPPATWGFPACLRARRQDGAKRRAQPHPGTLAHFPHHTDVCAAGARLGQDGGLGAKEEAVQTAPAPSASGFWTVGRRGAERYPTPDCVWVTGHQGDVWDAWPPNKMERKEV